MKSSELTNKTYEVDIEQTCTYTISVDAKDKLEAEELALEEFHKRWRQNDLIPVNRDRPEVVGSFLYES